jgi:hypothetical protein
MKKPVLKIAYKKSDDRVELLKDQFIKNFHKKQIKKYESDNLLKNEKEKVK